MFKRVMWTGIGYGLGFGSSVVVQRKVKRAVERYTPEHVLEEAKARSRQAAGRARALSADARAIVAHGRRAGDDIDLRAEQHIPSRRRRRPTNRQR